MMEKAKQIILLQVFAKLCEFIERLEAAECSTSFYLFLFSKVIFF